MNVFQKRDNFKNLLTFFLLFTLLHALFWDLSEILSYKIIYCLLRLKLRNPEQSSMVFMYFFKETVFIVNKIPFIYCILSITFQNKIKTFGPMKCIGKRKTAEEVFWKCGYLKEAIIAKTCSCIVAKTLRTTVDKTAIFHLLIGVETGKLEN